MRGGQAIGWWPLAALFACQPNSHPFIARLYEAAHTCVDPAQAVDVLDGPDPGTSCAPTCVLDTAKDLYITGACAPFPYGDRVVARGDGGPADLCTPAIAAYLRSDTCGPDGSASSNPLVPDATPAIVQGGDAASQ